MRFNIALAVLVIVLFLHTTEAWRRRRRRRCVGCSWSSWGHYGSCSASCGYGLKYRSRSRSSGACGAVCSGPSSMSASCYLRCCPVNCNWSWGSWSNCNGCGWSTRTRTVSISQNAACGGRSCPSVRKQTERCNTGVCCPVNCVVNSWGSWSSCNAACEKPGQQTRRRIVQTSPSCGGTSCPTLVETKACRGGCCRRDCTVSTWSAWGKCNAPPGKCGPSDGTRSRSRTITQQASCGGTCTFALSASEKCKPVPITCVVSGWSSYSLCKANSGSCGPGTQYRTRTITRQPYCSSPCPTLKETQACSAGCCPVNCVVSSWLLWSACSATCGKGTRIRRRTITTSPSCNGQACPSLSETESCSQYNNKDCVMSAWSSWSQCSNGCGSGMVTKTRTVVSQPVCQGAQCGLSSVSKACTSYRDNTDCQVGSWGSWGACSTKCAVGTKQRSRTITVAQRCRGRQCPTLMESSPCGSSNGGCQHVCSNGVCSCRPGYELAADKKTCTAKDCGKASPNYCPQDTMLGSSCKHAQVTCPGGNTTYLTTCTLSCAQYYSLKGSSTITCQTNGQWSSYSNTYCRRNNDPPTQILLSGSSSVAENQPRGTKIGTFSSLDPVNSRDTHTYSITKGASGLFELRGADLLTMRSFDFESSPNTFDITVRSTDNGVPSMYLDKTFTIKITDVNESPTDIQLSSSNVDENSGKDTMVGMLSTADPDKSQSFTYQLLDNAGGRFKVVNNTIKVAQSNQRCRESGGSYCSLNYEQQTSHVITVRSTDSGSPSKSIDKNFTIIVNDVNDQPRDFKLSNQQIKEDAPINSPIGQFSASDEDAGQGLVYSLLKDDNGRFTINGSGWLIKAKDTDYEKNKVHVIIAMATDNGQPPKSMTKLFLIIVLDTNDAPMNITLDNTSIKENSAPGTTIATVTGLDSDALQNLTFSLDDNADGKFKLENASLCTHNKGTQCTTTLQVSGKLNYEDAHWEMIRLRATDDKGKFVSHLFNITVVDVNDKPTNLTLEGSLQATVPENSQDVEIGELQTTDEDTGQTFIYTLLSNGNGNFEIRGNKLYVTKSSNLDYEAVQSYQLKVRSTDSGNPQYSIQSTLVISVTDQNEAPSDVTASNTEILENRPTGTVIGNLSITDPDNLGPQGTKQTHTCQLTNSANGMIGISSSNGVNLLTVGTAGVNYEAQSIVGITVQCTDPQGLFVLKDFNITVIDVNEAPTKFIVSNNKVKENQPMLTVVGTVTVVDPDNEKEQRQSFTFDFNPSSTPFDIRNSSLLTTDVFDYESRSSWSFSVIVRDNGNPSLSKTVPFRVDIEDTNDRPTSVQISSSFINENSPQGTVIGTLTTTDQDPGQSYTYICTDCASGRFTIDRNKLKVALSNTQCLAQGGSWCKLNYETKKKYSITVQSTDNGNPPYDANSTIDVILRDVNDQPRDLKLSNNKVVENATIDSLIGQFNASDEDVGQKLVFSLANDDNGRFRVDANGKLFKANDTNYETQKKHLIKAVVTDNGSPVKKMEKDFIIEVIDANDAPFSIQITSTSGQVNFPSNSPSVKENSKLNTIIGTIIGLDPDINQALTFRLDDDVSGVFTLDGQPKCGTITNLHGFNTKCTILLKLNGSLNYEDTKQYSITVRVTDTHRSFTTKQFTITVLDQNDPPTNITLSGSTVNENSNGALVGVFTTTDEDVNQQYVYTLLDGASGRFDVQGNKLYVSSNANLDFEDQQTYTINVKVQDNGSPSYTMTKHFSITVRDINEAPTSFNISNSHVIENSKSGTVIGSLSVRDPDNFGPNGTLQTHVCNVVGSQAGKFVVQSNVLMLGSAVLNYEQASHLDVEIKCTDNGQPPLSLSKTVRVTVGDVNEPPSNISLSSNTIAENTAPSLVGTFSTLDPDNEYTTRQHFKYRIVGPTSGLPFVVDDNALNTTRPLDYETRTSWTITVEATDSGDPSMSVNNTFAIFVVDVNEAPTQIILSRITIAENSDKDTTIANLSTLDPDLSQTHTYTLTNTASGRFKISQDKLQVAMSNKKCLQYGGIYCWLNYEGQRQHTIRMRSTDNGVPPKSIEISVTINITDVNDQPRDLKLSGYSVMENATTGTRIGQIDASDEDVGQKLTFTLVNDDNGRFKVDRENYLIKAKSTDYETSKTHVVTVEVTDNGSPSLKMTRNFTIYVNNINERPTNTSITSQNGQQSYPDNSPRVNENSPRGTIVGTLLAFDHDEVQVLKFSLIDDASEKFTVGTPVSCQNLTNIPGVKTKCTVPLLVNGSLNYEKSKTEDIIVKVTDPSGSTHTQRFTVQLLDTNDKPSDIKISGQDVGYIDENTNNALVGVLSTFDEDVTQTHTYRLITNGGWKFVVRADKVYTSMYANLNYEKKDAYSIRVRTYDNGSPRQFMDKIFTVKVKDINERPTDIRLSNQSVPENSPTGLQVGKISVIDPDNQGPRGPWQVHACIVIGNEPFIVNQSTNELVVAGRLNYETTPTIDVTLRCYDNGSNPLFLEKKLTVRILDVNEAPTSIRLVGSTVAENSGAVVIGKLSTLDPDNLLSQVQTFSYAIIGDSGLPFVIDGDSLNSTRSLDYETKSSWQITIKSTDNKGLSVQKKFIINVIDQNDPPSALNMTGPLSCYEDSPIGTYIGTVVAVDQDKGQSHFYMIDEEFAEGHTSNVSLRDNVFTMHPISGDVTLAASLNYEKYKSYTLVITGLDSGNPHGKVKGRMVITVKDVNEAPVSVTLSNNTVPENSAVNTVVGDLFVLDPDNAVITWQLFTCLVTDQMSTFKVQNHLQLAVAANALNYEVQKTYLVTILCTERNATNNITATFKINILDVNEPPYNMTITNTSIQENGNPGDIVGVVNVLDPDTPGTPFANITVAIQSQSPGTNTFKMDGMNLVTTEALDFEKVSSYRLTLIAQDSGLPRLETQLRIDIGVTDTNDPPSNLTLKSRGVYENSTINTVIGVLTAVDQDKGQTCLFEVVNPLELFKINGTTLLLSRSFVLNYEVDPIVNITIRVTDTGIPPRKVELPVAVHVLDSNDDITNIIMTSTFPVTKATIEIPENTPKGTLLANMTAVDEDVNQDHSCILLDGQTYFTLRMASKTVAQIFVKKNADLDYEKLIMSSADIPVTVQCTDAGSPPYSINESFVFTIQDINEPPINITLNGLHEVNENAPIGTVVGSLSCYDQDANQTVSFKVIGNSSSVFEVNPDNNTLQVKNPSFLDYEKTKGKLVVSILATDSAAKPLSTSRDFVIHIMDQNERPEIYSPGANVSEDIPAGKCITVIKAKDPDTGQHVTLALLSHVDTFTLSDTCENVSSNASSLRYVTSKGPLSYDKTKPSHMYSLLVQAKDDGIPPKDFNETVQINVRRIDPCDLRNDCNGNATCIRVNGTYHKCMCNPGFSGDGWNCEEIDECASNPCLSDYDQCSKYGDKCQGQCFDAVNNYTCICPKGFTGSKGCYPINHCEPNPCENDGTCILDVFQNSFQCECAAGFNGTTCQNNIDDCVPDRCVNGRCIDGINQFSCKCSEGFNGTLCQRDINDCENNNCKEHDVCILRDISDSSQSSAKCFDRDFVISMFFKPSVFSLVKVRSKNWQYKLQQFAKSNLTFTLESINSANFEGNFTIVEATDLYVLDTSETESSPTTAKRKRKDVNEKTKYTSVYFIARYRDYGIPVREFYLVLNRTCSNVLDPATFEGKICGKVGDNMKRLGIMPPQPRTGAREKNNNSLFGLHPYMYYVLAGIGGMVMLLLIIGVALRRRKSNVERRLRAFETHHELLDNDTLPTDILERHQLSNEGQGEGACNPMYGVSGVHTHDQPSFTVSDNPIYSRPDDDNNRQRDDAGFSNPMYESFKPIQHNLEEDSPKVPQSSEQDDGDSHYQVPAKLTKEKKKKKGKKKKGKPTNDDEDITVPDLASFNPMFASRGIYNDSGDDNPYAVPKRQPNDVAMALTTSEGTGDHSEIDDTGSPIYATPRKGKDSDGASNPLDDGEQDDHESEDDVPADIVSAFGFVPAKRLDGASGQSDC